VCGGRSSLLAYGTKKRGHRDWIFFFYYFIHIINTAPHTHVQPLSFFTQPSDDSTCAVFHVWQYTCRQRAGVP
jgi:hypothetical protein